MPALLSPIRRHLHRALFALALPCAITMAAADDAAPPPPRSSQLVVLGSGTPNADPDRSGPAVAIIANGQSYLIDCGPGIVRRAAAATRAGVSGLKMSDLQTLFLTHLHSDHTVGLPDLIFTPWVLGRTHPLAVYGPPGLRSMVSHLLAAWSEDIEVRTKGLEHANDTGYKVDIHEITPGPVYKDRNVTVTAFPVHHGTWTHAYGYRFETADRTFVISGDAAPSDSIAAACHGCDVLLHEIYAPGPANPNDPPQAYFSTTHTDPAELAALAAKAKPKLLVLYHQVFHGVSESDLLARVRRLYAGAVVSAHDLDIY